MRDLDVNAKVEETTQAPEEEEHDEEEHVEEQGDILNHEHDSIEADEDLSLLRKSIQLLSKADRNIGYNFKLYLKMSGQNFQVVELLDSLDKKQHSTRIYIK